MADTQTDVITTKTFFRAPPSTDAAPLPPDEYEARFLQAQADTVRAYPNHPPIPDEVLNDPDKARRYFGVWQMNHSFFAKMFPSYLMNIAAKCPYQDVRREILHDCWDEEVSDPDADGMCHIEVLYYDSLQLGITREEAEAFEPTPIFMACMHALDNLSRTLTWQGGYAAIGGLESIRVAVKRGFLDKGEFEGPWAASANRVEKLCGIPEGSLMNAGLHQSKDQVHGGGVLDILKKYATTREIQEETFWAIRTARSFRVVTTREQIRLARAAIGLPADELRVT